MRGAVRLGLALAGALAVVSVGCKAPTKHTGKRPITSRRESDFGPDKTLEQRLLEREAALGAVSEREGRSVDTADVLTGVGSTRQFHRADCERITDVERADRVLFDSRFDALDGGYHPCETCRPER